MKEYERRLTHNFFGKLNTIRRAISSVCACAETQKFCKPKLIHSVGLDQLSLETATRKYLGILGANGTQLTTATINNPVVLVD